MVAALLPNPSEDATWYWHGVEILGAATAAQADAWSHPWLESHLVSQMGRALRCLVPPRGCSSDISGVSALSDKDLACFGPAAVKTAIKRVFGQAEHKHLTLELFFNWAGTLFSPSFVQTVKVLEEC